jgi:hypothetical protein
MEKPPCVELRSPLNWCAQGFREQYVEGRLPLPAEWWNGWKINKGHLIGPGGMKFDARTLTVLWRAGRLAEHQRKHSTASRASLAGSSLTPL